MLRRHINNEQFQESFWPSNDQPEDPTAGQVLMEYIIVIGVVVLVLFAMSTLIKRSAQGMIKVVADQVGDQVNAEQKFGDSGYLESSYSSTRADTSKTKTELVGDTTYIFGDTVSTQSQAVINMGFTEEN